MISVRDQPESQYMSGCSSRTTVFLAKRASTSDADGPKAFPYKYQVSASESYQVLVESGDFRYNLPDSSSGTTLYLCIQITVERTSTGRIQ